MFIKTLWKAHRLKLIILVVVLVGGGYYWYSKINTQADTTRYITSQAAKQTIVVAVAGTGQIAASSQVDVKPDVGGKLVNIYVKNGDEVKSGQLIAQLDATDAVKAVNDAETNLETAKLNLEKLQEPPDELTLTKAENSLAQTQESLKTAQNNLDQDYSDANLTIAGTFLQLPAIMNGLQQMFYNSTYVSNQWNIDYYANLVLPWDSTVLNYKNDLTTSYNLAKSAYDTNFQAFQALSSLPAHDQTASLLQQTYNTTKLISDAIKKATSYLDFIDNVTVNHNSSSPQSLKSDQSTLRTYTSTTNNQVSSLMTALNNIETGQAAIVSAQRNLDESTLSLKSLKDGPDVLDIRAQNITIQQRQDDLANAKLALADYSVRAPFAGVVTNVDSNIRPGQNVSTGTIMASVITTQSVAEITLNEIDVAKIKTGEPATLTFDALDNVTLTGKIADIAQVGAVSQGVVSYSVKIALDTEDARVKPGMSVTANIITNSKADALAVPNSAVKTNAQGSYVEILENNKPIRKDVITGISNDTMTEITQGLKEGDNVITTTVTSSSASSSSSSATSNSRNSSFGAIRVFTGGSGRPPGD